MGYQSISELFAQACARGADRVALRHKVHGRWESVSWRGWQTIVHDLVQGLIDLGLQPGDRVAILSATRIEWVHADLATLCAGAVSVPIYHNSLPKECEFILSDSEAKFVFVEDEKQLLKLLEIRHALPGLKKIIQFSGYKPSDPQVVDFEDVLALGRQHHAPPPAARMQPHDLASIVYTSGTTGTPKGAMISHAGILFVAASASSVFRTSERDETLLFLPLAHIFARIIVFVCLHDNVRIAFAEGMDKAVENMAETHPTFVCSVPRLYEKIYARLRSEIAETSAAQQRMFEWALRIGRQASRHIQKREPTPQLLRIEHAIADRLVLRKVRLHFGGTLRFLISGGAPLSKEVAEFFHALGLLILEGYGLTESTGVLNVNRPDNFRFGTVGPPIPGVEQKIAPDGEILARGPGIFQGYWRRPQDTSEVLDAGGWLHTGDIGEFDEENRLRITDRKKDMIVTAGGKSIAPQNIENHLKTDPLFSQVMVYGDKRKYLTALVTLNYDEAAKYAQAHGIAYHSAKELAHHEAIRQRVAEVIKEKNKHLASYETIKRFQIVPEDFTQESGELTPTMKPRRKVIAHKYKALLDAMYDEDVFD